MAENNTQNFRVWKKGKQWLYAVTVVATLSGGGALVTQAQADTLVVSPSAVVASLAAADPSVAISVTQSSSTNSVATSGTANATSNSITASSVASSVNTESLVSVSSLASQTSISSSSLAAPDMTVVNNTTTQQFYTIANLVMGVGQDFTKNTSGSTTYKTGDIFYENADKTGQAYQILRAVDSADQTSGYPANGMQAMAVSPVINEATDTSQIIIAFAPTSPYTFFSEPQDWLTDVETVIAGSNTYTSLDGRVTLPSQAVTAKQFADEIIAAYPSSKFAITGFSLGGYLAMAIGAEEKQAIVAFEGPSPENILSAEDIAYVKANPSAYVDYRNSWDTLLGAYGGNGLGTASYFAMNFAGPIFSHAFGYTFDAAGNVTNPVSADLGPMLNAIMTSPDFIISPIAATITSALPLLGNVLNAADTVTGGAVSQVENGIAAAGDAVGLATGNLVAGALNLDTTSPYPLLPLQVNHGLANSIENAVTTTVSNVTNATATLVTTAAKSTVDTALSALAATGNAITTIATATANTITNVAAAVGNVTSAVSNTVAAATSWLKWW
ncbi:MAG: lipase family protein [Streptococcaceae bacterium]|jgi:hypothetical protein|nr:lipase family protein [Streptococcaceae bacterium]